MKGRFDHDEQSTYTVLKALFFSQTFAGQGLVLVVFFFTRVALCTVHTYVHMHSSGKRGVLGGKNFFNPIQYTH